MYDSSNMSALTLRLTTYGVNDINRAGIPDELKHITNTETLRESEQSVCDRTGAKEEQNCIGFC